MRCINSCCKKICFKEYKYYNILKFTELTDQYLKVKISNIKYKFFLIKQSLNETTLHLHVKMIESFQRNLQLNNFVPKHKISRHRFSKKKSESNSVQI